MNPAEHVSTWVELPILTYEYLKSYQRNIEKQTGKVFSDSYALTLLLEEHEAMRWRDDDGRN